MSTTRAISEDTRQTLQRSGLLEPPRLTMPSPNIADLLAKAIKRGFEVTLTASADEEDGRMLVEAAVTLPDGAWSAERDHPGVALADALAAALRATTPQQAALVEGAV